MTNMKRILTTASAGLMAAAANAQVPPQAPAQPPAQAPAQAPATEPSESLIDIYKRALDNDPAFREAEAQYLATTQVKPLARASLLPNLQLTGNRSDRHQDVGGGALSTVGVPAGSRTVIDVNSRAWQVSLAQTIFHSGQT